MNEKSTFKYKTSFISQELKKTIVQQDNPNQTSENDTPMKRMLRNIAIKELEKQSKAKE